MPVSRRAAISIAWVSLFFACAKPDKKDISTHPPRTASVKDCAASPQSLFCQIIAAWNEDQPPKQRADKFASLVSGKVRPEMNNPIAQCLALFRGYDKAAATTALHDCLGGVKPDLTKAGELTGGDLEGALGLHGSVRPNGPTMGGGQACGGGHINPWLAQTSKQWDYGNWWYRVAPPDNADHIEENKLDREYQRLQREANDKWLHYVEALEKEIEVDWQKSKGKATQAQLDAAKAETKRALDEANQAIEKRNLYRKALVEGNDAVSPNEDGTAYAHPVEGFENPCDEFNNFLKGCSASGWGNGACKDFLDKLNKCESTLILVDPDQGTACAKPATPTVDKATFDDIMTKVCWSKIRPVGPDENPCAPSSVNGAVVVTMQPNPCTDPRVRVDPESGECNAPLRDPQKAVDALLNRPKLAEVYATMEKLCACALPPIGGTRDPGTGPKPRPTYQAVAWSAEPAYRPFP